MGSDDSRLALLIAIVAIDSALTTMATQSLGGLIAGWAIVALLGLAVYRDNGPPPDHER